jgi:fatty-acyl-CoA synthase
VTPSFHDASYDFIAYFARSRANKIACVDLESGRKLTYRALDARVNKMAAALERMVGKEAITGARIATLARNSSDLVCLYLACLRTRAIYAPLNWRLTGAELAALARDLAPSVLVYDAEFDGAASAIAAVVPSAVCLDSGNELEAAAAAEDAALLRTRSWQDVTTLLCTSGTTGKPKAVMVTEANARANVANYVFAAHVGPSSVFLCDMPMFHVAGLFAVVRSTLEMGATVLISPRFVPDDAVRRIADPALGISHFFCAPQMAQLLRDAPAFDPARFRRLTALQTGGAPHPASAVLKWLDDGVCLIDGFGLSEAGTVLGMPPGDLDLIRRKAGASGLPAITIEVRLVDRSGRDVGDSEVGEIWLRGPTVTPGYWRNEEATRAAFQNGWLKTGDAAQRDEDGFFTVVDRWKEMYVSGGENVYPAEVEAALAECAGVAEAAVIGVPDARWGETGAAFIVRKRDPEPSEADVVQFCRSRLAAYKAPKHVIFIDTLPRTASGKLQKSALKARWNELHRK